MFLPKAMLLFTLGYTICFSNACYADRKNKDNSINNNLHDGDIIFQKIPCGDLCDAIIETTPCKPGRVFNHCGIVHLEHGKPFIIEAIGKAVKETTVQDFIKRDTAHLVYIGRLKSQYKGTVEPAIAKAQKYIGTPYDNAFLPGDSALYCSELVYDCYKTTSNQSMFTLAPMTFKSPHTHTFYPAWVTYYQRLKTVIPEGIPGINPCSLANDDKLEIITLQK